MQLRVSLTYHSVTVGVVAVLAVVLAILAAGYPIYVRPAVTEPSRAEPVDAVVALGGAPASAQYAVDLVRAGYATSAVVSDPYQTADVRLVHRLCSPSKQASASGSAAVAVRAHAQAAPPTPAPARAAEGTLAPSGVPAGVTCFEPEPATTRGEARAIAELAADRGWQRVAVVAPRYHVTRARYVVERCYAGELEMVAVELDTDVADWAYQYAYQTAAFGKAVLWQRGC